MDLRVPGRGIKYGIVSTRHDLDAILADRPVYIGAFDGHTGWANTKALEMAGILTDDGRELVNGIIVRDQNCIATGELREGDAMRTVMNLVPEPDANRKRELLKLAIHEFNKTGITSVHNMNGDMQELMACAALEDAGEMNMRVYVPFHVKPETKEEELKEAAEMANVQMDYVRGGAAKFFMDGVWGSYTAFNVEPYADDPGVGTVAPIFPLDHFTRMAAACDRMGMQIAVHCCGDAAVRQALDGYEAIQKANGVRDRRDRIEHIEVCQPGDMPRFKELGVMEKPAEEYDKYMRRVLDRIIETGALPIIATKADNLEGDHAINATIAQIAYEYEIPLWNFWAAVQPLPDHGLSGDGFHLTFARNFFDDSARMEIAWPWRNMTALQTLDAVRKALSE